MNYAKFFVFTGVLAYIAVAFPTEAASPTVSDRVKLLERKVNLLEQKTKLLPEQMLGLQKSLLCANLEKLMINFDTKYFHINNAVVKFDSKNQMFFIEIQVKLQPAYQKFYYDDLINMDLTDPIIEITNLTSYNFQTMVPEYLDEMNFNFTYKNYYITINHNRNDIGFFFNGNSSLEPIIPVTTKLSD